MKPVVCELLHILAGYRSDGSAVYEEVVVEVIGPGRYRLSQSPALTQGVAAGDELELGPDQGASVVRRGGNLCIQVFRKGAGLDLDAALERTLGPLQGYRDGADANLVVFTVPVSAG